uniref:Uncharacterized protein n=1 Tax=Ascaris lumbricoides TaxID=6252 RepID=A0A9J2PFZ8_ASCLU
MKPIQKNKSEPQGAGLNSHTNVCASKKRLQPSATKSA